MKIQNMEDLGAEYPSGAGVSGVDGRARYADIKKFLHSAYFNRLPNTKRVDDNRAALQAALQKIDCERAEREKNAKRESGEWVEEGSEEGSEDSSASNKRRKVVVGYDPTMDAICEDEWSGVFGNNNTTQAEPVPV